MKKLVTILAIALSMIAMTTSCTKDPVVKAKKYSFQTELNWSIKAYLFEYNDAGDKINSQTVEKAEVGQVYPFTAHEDATKVKCYIKYTILGKSESKWVQQVFMLKEGSTVAIDVNGDTIIGNKEP